MAKTVDCCKQNRTGNVCVIPLSAVLCVGLAVNAAETRQAGAGVAVHTVCAVGSILTGIALTLVDVLLTFGTTESQEASACECIYTVLAEPTITARVWVKHSYMHHGKSKRARKSPECRRREGSGLTGLAVVNVSLTVASSVA